jgi:tRNA G26 N,N-dimethylase Trm1
MFGVIKEGLSKILTKYKSGDKQYEVFYNPVQKLNRDISILSVKTFLK